MTDLPPPPGGPPPGFGPSASPPPPPPPPGAATGYVYGAPQPPTLPYATFGPRFGAGVVDLIIYVLFLVPGFVFLATGPTEVVPNSDSTFCNSDEIGLCEEPTDSTITSAILIGLAGTAGILVYRTALEGGSGQTIGKRVAGIRVVDGATGGRLSGGKAFGRAALATVMFLFCGIVYLLSVLWPLWDERRQTLHDKAVNAAVVRANPAPGGYGYAS